MARSEPTPAPDAAPDERRTMQCMEVWGGNQAIDNGVIMPGLDAWVYARPYEDSPVGGDVHYVSSCATGRITRILVADVSGHGVRVADVAGKLRALMRRYINYIDMGRFVRGINAEFTALAERGCFATAIAATYFAPTRYLTLCNAGHPRPLWYRSSRRAWEFLDQRDGASEGLSNIPLGIAEPTMYDQVGVHLSRGDIVLLYTDSLIEARDESGRLLGEAGLLELVRGLDATRPEALTSSLLGSVAEFSGAGLGALADDITVLVFRPNALQPMRSLSERLAGAGRALVMLVQAMAPGGKPFPWPDLKIANIGGALFAPLNRYWGRRGKGGGAAP